MKKLVFIVSIMAFAFAFSADSDPPSESKGFKVEFANVEDVESSGVFTMVKFMGVEISPGDIFESCEFILSNYVFSEERFKTLKGLTDNKLYYDTYILNSELLEISPGDNYKIISYISDTKESYDYKYLVNSDIIEISPGDLI